MDEVVLADAIRTLEEDHRRINDDLQRLESLIAGLTDGGSEAVRRVLAASAFFQKNLLPHLVMEEEQIFPRLKERLPEEATRAIKNLLIDHEILRSNYRAYLDPLTELAKSSSPATDRTATVRGAAGRLIAALRRHIKKEEQGLFAAALDAAPKAE